MNFKVEDRVEIVGNIPAPLRSKPRPLIGTVVRIDGAYIDVRPKYHRWVAEFYACELKLIEA